MPDSEPTQTYPDFRQALQDCQQLYVGSARECLQHYPHLVPQPPDEFVQVMDDLHRALLLKVFITIAQADGHRNEQELQLAQILFAHTWGQQLEGPQLDEAFEYVRRNSLRLAWPTVVRPFEEIAPLRSRLAELETIVMRLANMVARTGGRITQRESDQIKRISEQLRHDQRPVPIDQIPQRDRAQAVATNAVQKMAENAHDVQVAAPGSGVPQQPSVPEPPAKSPDERLADALAELDRLIGLTNIKEEVRTLANFLKMQQHRAKLELPVTDLSLHMVFVGNPGTGKTTVARIVAKIYAALGVLKKGHLVETDRSGLVAEYSGQTGPKTNAKIDEALDGVLFIDEAYSLTAERGEDAFGREAVQALLKRMEDDRERLVVILAGYPVEMTTLLLSNPGLSSRISRQLEFEDYTPEELGRIFGLFCKKNQYDVPPLARAKILLGLTWLHELRDRHFGNGRTVRNLFEHAIRRMANRIAGTSELTREQLTRFETEDIELKKVPALLFENLDDAERPFETGCPQCDQVCQLTQAQLGSEITCGKCNTTFVADWANPALAGQPGSDPPPTSPSAGDPPPKSDATSPGEGRSDETRPDESQ